MTVFFSTTIVLMFIIISFFIFKAGKKYFTVKVTHWMLMLYTIVLLISTAISPFITGTNVSSKIVSQKVIDQQINEIYTKIANGEIEKIDSKYLLKKEKLDLNQAQTINIISSNEYGPHIYVEKGIEGTNFEVYVYSQALTVNGMDFSDKLEPYNIDFKDGQLSINPTIKNLDISVVASSFPVRQITGESIMNSFSSSGDQIIYMKIPKDIKVVADEPVYLEYIN